MTSYQSPYRHSTEPRCTKMAVTVGAENLLKDMLSSCDAKPSRTFVATAQASHHGNTKKFDPRMAEKKRLAEEKAAREVELMRKTITRRVHEAHVKRDQLEAQRLKEIESEQSTFVQEVDGFLRIQHGKMFNQKKELHNLWTEQVYQKIQKQISDRVGNMDNDELNVRLNSVFQKYIDTVDNKRVFRDIIIESEYDPMENKKYTVRVDAEARSETRWDGIVDPLNEQIEKVLEIHQGNGKTKPISHQGKIPGKETLPTHEWESGKIEATPHGFAAKLFDKSIAEAQMTQAEKAQRAKRNMSSLNDGVMDHYDYPRDIQSILAEAPAGKKCFPGWQPNGQPPQKTTLLGPGPAQEVLDP